MKSNFYNEVKLNSYILHNCYIKSYILHSNDKIAADFELVKSNIILFNINY